MMRCLFPFFYTEAKCGPSGKTIKKPLMLIEMKFFRRTARLTLFDYKRNEENLEEMKIELN